MDKKYTSPEIVIFNMYEDVITLSNGGAQDSIPELEDIYGDEF